MIYLLRHGETEWNVERRMQGRKESCLTPRGRRQAADMAELLTSLIARERDAGWRLVSSPLGRAVETARAVADRLGLPMELDERLAEIGFGDWEGRLRDEVARQHPEVFASREWLVSAPGGETFDEVRTRAAAWLADLPAEPERRVIAVSHGVSGRLVRGVYAGLSREEVLGLDAPQDAIHRLAAGVVERLACSPLTS